MRCEAKKLRFFKWTSDERDDGSEEGEKGSIIISYFQTCRDCNYETLKELEKCYRKTMSKPNDRRGAAFSLPSRTV